MFPIYSLIHCACCIVKKKNCVGTWVCAINWELQDLKLCVIILDVPIWKTPSSSHIWKKHKCYTPRWYSFFFIIHVLSVLFIIKVNHCQFPWNIKLNLFKTHWLYSINTIHRIVDHENHEIPWNILLNPVNTTNDTVMALYHLEVTKSPHLRNPITPH